MGRSGLSCLGIALLTAAAACNVLHAEERTAEEKIADEAAAMAERGTGNLAADVGEAYRPASDTEWFAEARFGLFVHWGISSGVGGVWRGRNYFGITEWLWQRSQADAETYKALADEFNPTQFDAEEWVDLAVDAGARYMVVTAKHHDGFALFDTKASKFDVIDATPFDRDPLAELAKAAKARSMRLGFYYSQYQDWEHPHGAGNDWEYDAENQDFRIYQNEKAIPQLTELLTNYGDVALIWFDTPGDATKESAMELVDLVRDLQPDTLISSRIGHGLGDYQNYRDSEVPVEHLSPRPWEAIFPHNESWGYSRLDTDFKSTTELLHLLALTSARGGNLLLNVGPDGEGRIPEGSAKRLRAVGEWLEVNGVSIYGTRPERLGQLPWGVTTRKGQTLFLHVLHAPRDREMFVPRIGNAIRGARFLASDEAVEWDRTSDGVVMHLPQRLPDERNSVIAVSLTEKPFASGPDDLRTHFIGRQYGSIELSPQLATLSGKAAHENLRYWLYFGQWKYFPTVSGLEAPDDAVTWRLNVVEPGEYKVSVVYAANADEAGQEGRVAIESRSGEVRLPFRVLETGTIDPARPVPTVTQELGIHDFRRGPATLSIEPAGEGRNLFRIRSVILTPVD